MQPTFSEFEATMKAQGCDEVMVREWGPSTTADLHTHTFDAKALVVQGEMWLTVGDATQHLLPGGTFELKAGQPHSERYGDDGAVYWVGRSNH
jgi:quercetin dioxygenase-like cupin family protein